MDEKEYWQSWIPILEMALEKAIANAPAISDAHQIDHIHRVWKHSENLGKKLDADLEILVAASYLHDLGRHHIQDKAHGALSAKLAEPILKEMGFPKEKQEKTRHAIKVHDVTYQYDDRNSIESKILFDADKLDSFGAIGVVRNILFYYGRKSIDFILDDLKAKWLGLSLDETREYAKTDYEYTVNFFRNLKQAQSS